MKKRIIQTAQKPKVEYVQVKEPRQKPWGSILILIIIVAVLWAMWDGSENKVVSEGQKAEVSISAEEIQRILEITTASQKVVVDTDTAYVSKSVRQLFGMRFKMLDKYLETTNTHRLKERRSWLFRAGSDNFSLKKVENGYILEVETPKVLSREHIAEEFQEIEREGVWNPVTMQKLEISSRNRAEATAVKSGLLKEAKLSLEGSLLKILPSNVKIIVR